MSKKTHTLEKAILGLFLTIAIFVLLPISVSSGGTLTQNDWDTVSEGGIVTLPVPAETPHVLYESKSAEIDLAADNIKMSKTDYTGLQTSDDGSADIPAGGSGFNAGTATKTSISGSGTDANIILGAFVTAGGDGVFNDSSLPTGLAGYVASGTSSCAASFNYCINTNEATHLGVYNFTSFTLTKNVGAYGTNPLIIKSSADITITGTLNGSGTTAVGQGPAPGGIGGPGGKNGGRGGYGSSSSCTTGALNGGHGGNGASPGVNGTIGASGGNAGSVYGAGGAGFGGAGGNSYQNRGGTGGAAYPSDLSDFPNNSGGSGGKGGGTSYYRTCYAGGGGGGGGGILKLTSGSKITINGKIWSKGGGSSTGILNGKRGGAGGGGSGGSIWLQAPSVINNSASGISVQGGSSAPYRKGGGGGGGVVRIDGTFSGTNPILTGGTGVSNGGTGIAYYKTLNITEYQPSGNFISSAIDLGSPNYTFSSINYTASIPTATGATSLKFQIASSTCSNGASDTTTCASDVGWGDADTPFVGADNSADTFFIPPILSLHLNEASGITATDSGGRSFDGTLTNFADVSTSLTGDAETSGWNSDTAKITNALKFLGSDSNYVTVADNADLSPSTALTAEAWINPSVLAPGKAILTKWIGGSSTTFYIQTDPGASNELRVSIATGSTEAGTGATYGYTTDASLVVDIWYHIVVVYDSTGADNATRLKLYLNGDLKTLTYDSGTIPNTLQDSTASVQIGGNTTAGSYFTGLIDEVNIYNYAMSGPPTGQSCSTESQSNNEICGRYNLGNATEGLGTIPYQLDNKQYLQYKMYLATADTSVTPTLNDISIIYSGYPAAANLVSSAFDSGTTTNIIKSINWTESGISDSETVTLSVATSANSTISSYTAFTSASCGSTTCAGSNIPAGLRDANSDKWFGYKVALASGGSATATADSVNIIYSPVHYKIIRNASDSTTITADKYFFVDIQLLDSSNAVVDGDNSDRVIKFSGHSAGSPFAKDKDNNPVAFGAGTILTFVNGVAENVPVKLTIAENVSLAVTFGNDEIVTTSTLDVTVNPDTASMIAFTSEPQILNAGNASLVYTIKTQDSLGNVSNVGTTNILLTSSSGGGSFSASSTGTYTPTLLVTISVGTNSKSFFYKDTVYAASGSGPILYATDQASIDTLNEGIQRQLVVNPKVASKLVFTNDPQTLTAWFESSVYTIQAQDEYSNPSNVGSNITIDLTTSNVESGKLSKFLLSSGGAVSTSVTISSGSNSTTFFYQDQKASTPGPTLTATDTAASPITPASQEQVKIVAADATKLVFTTVGKTLTAGIESDAYTIQSQDSYDNPSIVSADVQVNLSSNTAGTKQFAASATGASTTNVTILSGLNSVVFFYTDEKAQDPGPTLSAEDNASSSPLDTIVQPQVIINPKAGSKLVITTAKKSLVAGTESDAYTVQVQDQYSNPSNVSADLQVNLTSDSAGTNQFAAALAGSAVTSVTIPAGSNSVNFFYTDEKKASPGPTIATTDNNATPITADSQEQTVVDAATPKKLIFTNTEPSFNNRLNTSGGAYTVEVQDIYDNQSELGADATVTLTTDSAGGTFSTDSGSTWGATSIVISGGTFSKTFDYKDTVAGRPLITATATSLDDGTQNTTVNGYVITVNDTSTDNPVSIVNAGTAYYIKWEAYGSASNKVFIQISKQASDTSPNYALLYNYSASSVGKTSPQLWAKTQDTDITSDAMIKIVDNSTPSITSFSGGFSVSGGLALDSGTPAANEKWSISTPHSISWERTGTFKVFVEYYNGSSWAPITNGGQSNTSGSLGLTTFSMLWTPSSEFDAGIGSAVSKIRVSDASTDNPASSSSSSTFTVASVKVGTLGFPNYPTRSDNGSAVNVGDTLTIPWTSVGANYARIQYSTDGSTWADCLNSLSVAAKAVDSSGGNGSFSWVVPDAVSINGATIKISAVDNLGGYDSTIEGAVSNTSGSFTIFGDIAVTTPNTAGSDGSGGAYDANSDISFTWTASSTITAVKFYSSTNSSDWTELTGLNSANDLIESWEGSTTPHAQSATYWIKIVDSNDSNTTAISEQFAIGGISLTSIAVNDTLYVGDTNTTVSGSVGGGITTVGITYSSTGKNGTYTTLGAGSDGVGVSLKAYSYTWATIPDAISDQVYIKVVSGGSVALIGPIKIAGRITTTNITGPWYVGETDKQVSWTIDKGTIPTVDIKYSTNGGSSWTVIASGISSSASPYAWSAGVADDISETVTIKVMDANTTNRPESSDVIASAFAIRGKLTVTSTGPSPAYTDNWAVNRPDKAIKWNTTGSVGNVNIYYSTEDDSTPYETWVQIPSAEFSTVASGGSGITPVTSNITWSRVKDLLKGRGTPPNNTAALKGTVGDRDIGVRIKVQDADNSDVYTILPSSITNFNIIYYQIKWYVVDSNSKPLVSIDLEDAATNNPSLSTYKYATQDLSTNAGIYRYYPYNGNLTDDLYNSTFTQTADGVPYTGGEEDWQATQDKTIEVTMDTAATAAINYDVNIRPTYNDNNDAIDVNIWLTRKGSLANEYKATTDKVTVVFNDSTGVPVSSSIVYANNTLNTGASKLDNNGVFYGITYNPSAGLMTDITYTITAEVKYKGQKTPFKGVATFKIPAVMNYEVMIEPAYSVAKDSIVAKIWLTKAGTVVREQSSNIISSVFPNSSSTAVTIGAFDTNIGAYPIEYDPSGGISTSTVYTITSSVTYRSHTYSGNKTFNRTEGANIDEISTAVDSKLATKFTAQTNTFNRNLKAKLNEQKTDINNSVSTNIEALNKEQTATLQAMIANETKTISENVELILEDTSETIPDLIEEKSESSSTATLSRLLNREKSVKSGNTIRIRYQTDAGLAPTISVYNEDNSQVISSASMTTSSSSGVYEYKLKVETSWGLGDFTVTASNGKGNMDSMVLSIISTDLDSLASEVASSANDIERLANDDSSSSEVKDNTDSLNDLTAQVDSIMEKITALTNVLIETEETNESGESNLAKIATKDDLNQLYETIVGISGKLSAMGTAEQTGFGTLFEISKSNSDNIGYLNDKATELKMLLELNQELLDKSVNKPIIKTWYEKQ